MVAIGPDLAKAELDGFASCSSISGRLEARSRGQCKANFQARKKITPVTKFEQFSFLRFSGGTSSQPADDTLFYSLKS